MELCDRNHEPICYECRHCPLCELHKEYVNLDKENEKLYHEVEDLKGKKE